MLLHASVVGFIPVRDMAVAEAFYCGKLGLAVIEYGEYALVVSAANGVTIRCVLTRDFSPQSFTILGWEVADIHTAVRGLQAVGIEMLRYPYFEQDDDAIWTAPGDAAQVAWFNDPFENVLSLSHHGPAARPS